MASVYKNFVNNDVASAKTLLHESVPITGSIVSGTYASNGNIKDYSHGMFQSVYDYPYLSSSANHIFDITVGYSNDSGLSGSGIDQNAKKINVYNEFAQVLNGYDVSGNIKNFKMPAHGEDVIKDAFFIPFSRLLVKDEIKKGSFEMELGANGTYANPFDDFLVKITDASGSDGYFVDSPAGEYGILSASGPTGQKTFGIQVGDPVGLIYYQAGIVVLTSSIFSSGSCPNGGVCNDEAEVYQSFGERGSKAQTTEAVLSGSTIEQNCNAVRNRLYNISFNNTTELNSTIYFCRAGHNEFNYSSNPTYLSGSRIRVKEKASDNPNSYITTVGLYSPDNELLAVAKTSEPIKKTPANEFTLRVRLDY